MSLFKKTLAVAAATLALGAGAAHASTTYVPMNAGTAGDFDDTWTVSGKQARNATSFDDYFVFDVPDTQDISLTLTGTNATFDGFALYDYATGDLLELDLLDTSSSTLSWADVVLTSGTYELEVAGEYLGKSGGTYTGTILGVEPAAAVPEPASWALLLLGLGAITGISRRRRG